MAIYVIDVDEVNSADQSFAASVYFEARWKNPLLRHKRPGPKHRGISEVWSPRLIIIGQQMAWRSFPESVDIQPEGTVIYRKKVCGAVWDRVQSLVGQKVYKQHQMTYASDLIECRRPITGERKTKMTKSGERNYMYYRCTQYHKGDHPRVRLTEADLDSQMLEIFDKLRVDDDEFRETIREELR